jgi:hypothetical protein
VVQVILLGNAGACEFRYFSGKNGMVIILSQGCQLLCGVSIIRLFLR